MVIDQAFDPFSGAFGRPTVAMDYDGDFVAAFMNGDNADYDIYARQYAPRPAGGRVGSGVVFHDVNGNGARDADDPGASGWRVYNDLNNNGQFDRSSYPAPSGAANTPLPPFGSRHYLGPGPSPAQAVGDVITDINVTINIQFPTDGDLTAWLVSPTGRRAQLFSHVGGAGQNFTQTAFDDTGAFSINQGTAPFTGTFSTPG